MSANLLDFLHGVDVVEIDDAIRPIQQAKSSVIAVVGTAPKGAVNEPVLILGSRREAVAIFGPNRNDGFTIPQALDAIFDQVGAMVVVVNVLDPETSESWTEIEGEEVTLSPSKVSLAHRAIRSVVVSPTIRAPYVVATAGTVTAPTGCQLIATLRGEQQVDASTLVVGDKVDILYSAGQLVAGTDYTVDSLSGVITRVADAKILPSAKLMVAYEYLDPSTVDSSNIIGTVDEDGISSGLQCLMDAKSKVFVQPRIIIAPGFTHDKPDAATRNPVVTEIEQVAEKLKGVGVVDCADSTREAAAAHRSDFGNDRLIFCYPWFKVVPPGTTQIVIQPPSARMAGVMAMVDNDGAKGFWWSPSNNLVNGVVGLSKPVDFQLGDPNCTANYLNSLNICTFIFDQGFKTWGNRASSGEFIQRRRTADMIEESVLFSHMWAVDKNITRGYLEMLVSGVNEYMARLQAVGAILGGKAWADREINTPTTLAQGHVYIDFDFTTPTPAERITFRAHLVDDYAASVFATDRIS